MWETPDPGHRTRPAGPRHPGARRGSRHGDGSGRPEHRRAAAGPRRL